MDEVIKGVIGGLMIGIVFFTFLGIVFFTFFELVVYQGRKILNSDTRVNRKYLSKPHEGSKS